MKLNHFILSSEALKLNTRASLIKKFLAARDLVADIYFDGKFIASVSPTLFVNSHCLVASLTAKIALLKPEVASNIIVKMHSDSSPELNAESCTDINFNLRDEDNLIRLYISVLRTNCERISITDIMDSKVVSYGTTLLKPKSFIDLPLMPGIVTVE